MRQVPHIKTISMKCLETRPYSTPLMKGDILRNFTLTAFLLILLSGCANFNGNIVSNPEEFHAAISKAKPGDKIILKDGDWNDAELLMNARGTLEKPITITAQTKGKVLFTGLSNFRISGEYLNVSGFVFIKGYTPSNEVISFREKKGVYGNNCNLTECVIDNYNNHERQTNETWIALYGKNNSVGYCYLTGKRTNGVTFTVRLIDEACRENNHYIHHNYFGYRQNLGANGGETMRLGTSHYSMATSGTRVEYNYFDRCDGEHEIISVKSCGNIFRYNTFNECRGTLTYRHGNDNIAEGNYFLGNFKEHTGGIRIINERNKAVNNYFYGLKGTRFRGALVIMNGVPNSPLNRYHQVKGGVFSGNTFIECDNIQLCAGSDSERSLPPADCLIENNVFYHSSLKDIFTVYDDISGISFSNNYLNNGVNPLDGGNLSLVEINKTIDQNGLPALNSSGIKNAGFKADAEVASKNNCGPEWYPKQEEELTFDTGEVITVSPGINTIPDALQSAKPGSIMLLEDGEFISNKEITIKVPVTIKANHQGKAMITSERSEMITIENEGALKLVDLVISGSASPDQAGNCIVSTSKYSMNRNYKLIVEGCTIEKLDVNHSFDFLRIYKNTFADSIVISNSRFDKVTGNIASLNKETDDLGIYNAECVVLNNSSFNNIEGSILDLYRGGTDESTFGPILNISDCEFNNVGNGSRNKTVASLYLHGVQICNISSSSFIDSRSLRLHLTNGEPVTVIDNCTFINSDGITSNSQDYRASGLMFIKK